MDPFRFIFFQSLPFLSLSLHLPTYMTTEERQERIETQKSGKGDPGSASYYCLYIQTGNLLDHVHVHVHVHVD